MLEILKEILNWSEVWALLIPLAIIIVSKGKAPHYLKPIKWYVYIALLINISINVIWKFKDDFGVKEGSFWWSNNFLYNTHSIIRLLLFSWFFNLLDQRFMHRVKAVIPFAFLVWVIINFIFFQNFFAQRLSSRLLATEAALLLFYCLQYYIYLILEEKTAGLSQQPGFWVVAGLSIYVAANFFIFLFYSYLLKKNLQVFAVNIWDVHNVAYILLCTTIAIQFYRVNKKPIAKYE